MDPARPDDDFRSTPVEAGVHWVCSCGLTFHAPFCDGSHKGTGCQPLKFVAPKPLRIRWRKSGEGYEVAPAPPEE